MRTFVSKVMSLLFNMLSICVIAFLPQSKCLLTSWLQSPSAVILEPEKVNSVTVSTFSLSICHEVMGPNTMILVFYRDFPGGPVVKNLPAEAGDTGSNPDPGRSYMLLNN